MKALMNMHLLNDSHMSDSINSVQSWSAIRVHGHISDLNFQGEAVKLVVTAEHKR